MPIFEIEMSKGFQFISNLFIFRIKGYQRIYVSEDVQFKRYLVLKCLIQRIF